jgi:hypothetical protein
MATPTLGADRFAAALSRLTRGTVRHIVPRHRAPANAALQYLITQNADSSTQSITGAFNRVVAIRNHVRPTRECVNVQFLSALATRAPKMSDEALARVKGA